MRPILGSILLLTLLATACSKTNSSPGLIGAWKMVGYNQGPTGPTAVPADSAVTLYLWSNNRYLQVSAGAVVDSGVYVYDNISPMLMLNSRKWLEPNPPLPGQCPSGYAQPVCQCLRSPALSVYKDEAFLRPLSSRIPSRFPMGKND